MTAARRAVAVLGLALLAGAGTAASQDDLIFADGFESGGTERWSATVGAVLPVVDLRADVNRNGTVDLDDPSEDAGEDSWDRDHGAIFLANLDDDQSACPTSGTDGELAACHDAADAVVNGPSDLLDLARVATVPWPAAPDDASATLTVSTPAVRLFRSTPLGWELFDPAVDGLSAAELRAGVELALEGVDLVRDAAVWDGLVDLTLVVHGGTGPGGQPLPDGTDTVRLRQAPVLFRHHLDPVRTVYVNAGSWQGSAAFRADLQKAATAAGVPDPLFEIWGFNDQWTQDHFEAAYASMPAAGGQHVIHVNFRMPEYYGGSLRTAGRVVFTHLRGPDMAGAVQYDPAHPDTMEHLNAGGNTETIPPYSHDGAAWPFGRVVQGSTESEYTDRSFVTLVDSQGLQPVLSVDTSWLTVGHVDETVSFLATSSPRGWLMLVADPAEAWAMLQELHDQGHGATPMFVGRTWMGGVPAEITVDEVLADADLATATAWAAAEIAGQVDQLQAVTGVTAAEMVSAPFTFCQESGGLLAYQPGLVNGISLSAARFGAPAPHGPEVGGEDPFAARLEANLAPHGVGVDWVENWDLYHRYWGEVHCGSNVTREVPATPWWESLW